VYVVASPDLVITLMWAPLLAPCDASYMEVLTAISGWSPAPASQRLRSLRRPRCWSATTSSPKSHGIQNERFSPTWLVDCRLNRLSVPTPLSEKLLWWRAGRCVDTAWFPSPVLARRRKKSQWMPGVKIAVA